MFKFDELCELIRLVGSTEVAMRRDRARRWSVAHRRQGAGAGGEPRSASPGAQVSAPRRDHRAAPAGRPTDAPAAGSAPEAAGAEEDLHYVVSPIVGTFYRAPNPGCRSLCQGRRLGRERKNALHRRGDEADERDRERPLRHHRQGLSRERPARRVWRTPVRHPAVVRALRSDHVFEDPDCQPRRDRRSDHRRVP